ncbi:MAG: hypothetical protein IT483_05475 [Gammaproteobacteria bacterium]|nr:hypothetical protein [Gammaproteobacteria bacterium]
MHTKLPELLDRLRSASTVTDCLNALIDSREIAQTRIVGFREAHNLPAITRMPRPIWWSHKMGWPKGFIQEWIRLNLGERDAGLAGRNFPSGAVSRWELPVQHDHERDSAKATRNSAVAFLARHGIREGWIAAVDRSPGVQAYVSWMVPLSEQTTCGAQREKALAQFAELFFRSLDRVRPLEPVGILSPIEQRCLAWAAYGCTDSEIAGEIGRAMDTVRFHMKNILKKLGAANRTHAVAVGIQKHVIQLGKTPPRTRRTSTRRNSA